MNKWILVKDQLPKEGELVDTKIDDGKEVRNEQPLKRFKNLWFEDEMYVYYIPTHWKQRINK